MQPYRLVSISISFIALLIFNKFYQSATAHDSYDSQSSRDNRVGFNQQISYSLSAVNRAQQAYYFEQAKFAKNRDELSESGFNLGDNDNYEFVIDSEDSSAFIYGIAQQDYGTYKVWSGSSWEDEKEPLYSYVSGIAYIKENGTFQSVLCVSKIIGEQKLPKPKIVDRQFTCSEDTEKI